MSGSSVSDANARVIEEFRANGGKVGGPFEGSPLLLLHHTGARSGKDRVTPLMYQQVDGGYTVFATKGGAPAHPDWYYNLIAHPGAEIEIGDGGDTVERKRVTARVLQGEERDKAWEQQKQQFPEFAGYEERTDRVIPAVFLRVTE